MGFILWYSKYKKEESIPTSKQAGRTRGGRTNHTHVKGKYHKIRNYGGTMKKFLKTLLFLAIAFVLSAEEKMDFCDHTVLVVLCPTISEFDGNKCPSFFGTFEKKSVENIFRVTNEKAIKSLKEQGRKFRSIYLIKQTTSDIRRMVLIK